MMLPANWFTTAMGCTYMPPGGMGLRLKRSFKPNFQGLFLLIEYSQGQKSALLFSMYNLEQA